MNYTVIGDDVNLASRLEGLNKQWGTSVMVSEDTAEEIEDFMHLRYVISIAVVGKQKPVKVYEAMGPKQDYDKETLDRHAPNEASESQTVQQVNADRDMEELAKRYGEVADGGTAKLASAGRLLRRCLRRRQVTPEEVTFAAVYETAIAKWDAGDFAGCAATLRGLGDRGDVPSWASTCLSVKKVLDACEANLKSPPPAGSWTGVWVANEK
uniref:Guanylate cyclase domain-containing protein n=1 Tax=Neobodo designis TaxID=312471 RepID=A0A7S1LIA6_NEODS|mmetsp:Transcript_22395/g.69478  ORF Transcript_22395/g.69478 Transcript_22395/m.69478 type:complete len:211 (+) Transcript_22395:1-633(+)